MKALREIRKYQRTCDLLIPKMAFARLVLLHTHHRTTGTRAFLCDQRACACAWSWCTARRACVAM
jgi:histone H3/H4